MNSLANFWRHLKTAPLLSAAQNLAAEKKYYDAPEKIAQIEDLTPVPMLEAQILKGLLLFRVSDFDLAIEVLLDAEQRLKKNIRYKSADRDYLLAYIAFVGLEVFRNTNQSESLAARSVPWRKIYGKESL